MENNSEKKSSSYYDWEKSFKSDKSGKPHLDDEDKVPNSMGIPDNILKPFLESWKEKNL